MWPFNSNRCYNGGKRHNFKAIFNLKPVSLPVGPLGQFQEARTEKEYRGHICEWCGTKIEDKK